MNEFKLFSLIFSPPYAETVDEILNLVESGFSHVLSENSVSLLKKGNGLMEEYTELFVNSYPKISCPPYESFYKEGILYGNSTMEVMKIYRENGFVFDSDDELPDHISVELEFLALTGNTNFLNRFYEWVFDFIKQVKKHGKKYEFFAADFEKFLKQI